MIRKRLSSIFLLFNFCILGLFLCCMTGCSSEDTLVLGTNAYFPPYEYYDNNEIVGVDMDIAKEVANRMGKKLVIEDMEFDTLIQAVTMNKVDVVFAAMTITEERQNLVDFTDSYATGVQDVIVLKDSSINTIDDLNNAIIGVQQGTTGCIYAHDDFDTKTLEFSRSTELLDALKSGKIDAVIIDNGPANTFVAEDEELRLLETHYVVESYAACVNKNNKDLLNEINLIIKEMQQDGTIDNILKKYGL